MGQCYLNPCLNSTGFVFCMREQSNAVIWLFSDSCRILTVIGKKRITKTKKESPIIAKIVSAALVKYLFFFYISVLCLHYSAAAQWKSQCSSEVCFMNEISSAAASSSAVEPIFAQRCFCMSLGCVWRYSIMAEKCFLFPWLALQNLAAKEPDDERPIGQRN